MNKISLIIGGSKGIGRAIAITLAKEGYENILVGRDSKELQKTKKQCDEFKNSHVIPFDITQNQQELVQQILQLAQNINFIWLGARSDVVSDLENIKENEIGKVVRTNLESQILLIKNLFEVIKQSQTHIITACSDGIWGDEFNLFGPSVFQSTKVALESFGKLLYNETKKYGIKVTNLKMGNVGSLEGYALEDNEKQIKERGKTMLTLKDVCDTVLFILSRECALVTEVTISPEE